MFSELLNTEASDRQIMVAGDVTYLLFIIFYITVYSEEEKTGASKSEDYSYTSDLVQETKRRLRSLEHEAHVKYVIICHFTSII